MSLFEFVKTIFRPTLGPFGAVSKPGADALAGVTNFRDMLGKLVINIASVKVTLEAASVS